MPTRKKNAAQPRRGQCKNCGAYCGANCRETPPTQPRYIELMLMIGNEHVMIHSEEDDNIDFMAELIDP